MLFRFLRFRFISVDFLCFCHILSRIDAFEGIAFAKLSEMAYAQFGCLVFAMQLQDRYIRCSSLLQYLEHESTVNLIGNCFTCINPSNHRKRQFPPHLFLNPSELVIPPLSMYKIEAYIIALNRNQADLAMTSLAIALSENAEITKSQKLAGSWRANALSKTTVVQEQVKRNRIKRASILVTDANLENVREASQSQQIRYLEKQHLLNSCRTYKDDTGGSLPLLSDATIYDFIEWKSKSSTEMSPEVGHIIITGGLVELSSIFNLIKPLRVRTLEHTRPIVILHPQELPVPLWAQIRIFSDIYIVRGSPLEEEDLCRAGIFEAHSVILLSDVQSNLSSSKDGSSHGWIGKNLLVDSNSIFIFKVPTNSNQNHVKLRND